MAQEWLDPKVIFFQLELLIFTGDDCVVVVPSPI
jgi:hypothetical protein